LRAAIDNRTAPLAAAFSGAASLFALSLADAGARAGGDAVVPVAAVFCASCGDCCGDRSFGMGSSLRTAPGDPSCCAALAGDGTAEAEAEAGDAPICAGAGTTAALADWGGGGGGFGEPAGAPSAAGLACRAGFGPEAACRARDPSEDDWRWCVFEAAGTMSFR
jgi:hypothetical protein